MSNPLVSIIVPTYNNGDTIKKSLLSLVNQSYPKTEIIIVYDEGSVDDTKQILSRLAKDFPKTIRIISTEHVGRSVARNIGWKNSLGEILFFADSDDIYNENYLEKAVAQIISDPKIGGVTLTGSSLKFESTFVTECIEVYSRIKRKLTDRKKITPNWAWVYRREAIEKVDGFDERLNQAEDKDLYLRVKNTGYSFSVVSGVNWHHTRRGNLGSHIKKRYLAGKRRLLFIIKHNLIKDFFRNIILFWVFVAALLASFLVKHLFYLILGGFLTVLGYDLVITLKEGWNVVPNKKYLFCFPFFKLINYFASALGYTHGFLLVCLEKLSGKKIDWSRV
jgi:glycosyltransferase involved in cell wall biosynthesis